MSSRVVFVGLDACDLHVAQSFARDGDMPVLARMLGGAAAMQETVGPLGWLVGGNWPTIYTGTTPSRHQFLCSGQIPGGTYENAWLVPINEPRAIWDDVSDAGGRVAVLDAPHAAAREQMNGVQLVEWGCHDRHAGTKSYPETFLDDVHARYGRETLGESEGPFPHAAPCDTAHRAGVHRTVDEDRALLDDLLTSAQRKIALSRDLLREQDWSLVFTVFGESHCAGHQFWKLHDPTHPWHDAAHRRALGVDPLRAIYGALDRGLGELIDAAGHDAAVYVLLSHGMQSHFDGTNLIEPVLWRLDEYASRSDARGLFTRATDSALDVVPRVARDRALRTIARLRGRAQRGSIGPTPWPEIPWLGQRRWWMQPNDSVYGSVRLNVEGREPNGRIAAGRARAAAWWLADRLYELVNAETGEPAVAHVYLTDDHYERVPGDPMGDVIIEWNRAAPINAVWSPATGLVSVPYRDWRTGDHHRGGLLLAAGPGIAPGRRAGVMPVVDIAPTLAAALDLDCTRFDGVPHDDLIGGVRARVAVRPRPPEVVPVRPHGARRWSRARMDVDRATWNEEYAIGLARTAHAHHLRLGELERELADTRASANRIEHISAFGAWLAQVDVPETMLVSVVMPTCDRVALLERAIDSVQRQQYGNWELLVVDDASTDDTWARLQKITANDPRVRPSRLDEKARSSGARNHALERVEGDVVVYLDDDNRFDPSWLKAVVWAFTEHPAVRVAYGARVIDDDIRHRGLPGRSLPVVQLNEWDRTAMLRANLVDQNVIAHRPAAVRFDPKIDHFSDWDLLLQLTDDCDPMPLPAIAAYYYTDAMRLSDAFTNDVEQRLAAYVRTRTRERRA
jgi:predicted AlkP superfamily phosphohydrolase/phosphomutase